MRSLTLADHFGGIAYRVLIETEKAASSRPFINRHIMNAMCCVCISKPLFELILPATQHKHVVQVAVLPKNPPSPQHMKSVLLFFECSSGRLFAAKRAAAPTVMNESLQLIF